MKTIICKFGELDLRELAKFTSVAQTGTTDKTDMFAGWFEEDLLPLEHVVILGKEAEQLLGWVLLVDQGYNKLEVNPWLLGGNPVVSPEADKKVGETLLKKAVQWAQNRSARSISLTILLEEDESANQIHETYYTTLGFPKLLRYVEMKCDLSVPVKLDISLPTGIEFVSLADAKEDELYICYLTTFQQGDAKFFFTQSENERRDYFNSLGLEDARGYTGSSVLQKEGQLIGFTYVLPYGEGNGHISCMCIHPDYQGKGLGRVMLHNAMHAAHEHGLQSMTLGTEVGMRAFNLYKKNGFDVLGGAVVFEREL